MNKKLLSSLMAALMLIPQGASLSAKNPVSEFVKNHKKIVVGGAGLAAGLAAGIAYLVSTHNTGKVVELDSHALSLDDMTLDKSEYEKILDTGIQRLRRRLHFESFNEGYPQCHGVFSQGL